MEVYNRTIVVAEIEKGELIRFEWVVDTLSENNTEELQAKLLKELSEFKDCLMKGLEKR